MIVRAFISGVMRTHELDEDRRLAQQAVESLGPTFSAFAYQALPGVEQVQGGEQRCGIKCNFLILLLARTITPKVRDELRYARLTGMPTLVFLREEESRSPELDAFLNSLESTVHTYSSRTQLYQGIRDSLLALQPACQGASKVDLHVREVWHLLVDRLYRSPGEVFSLTPREFEELITELLSAFEYEVKLTKRTRDRGFDLIAVRTGDPLFPSIYLVEAKLWTPPRNVGHPVIQSLYGAGIAANCSGVMAVTTSGFTQPAIDFVSEANLRTYIQLLDGKQLPALYQRYLQRMGRMRERAR